MFFVVCFVFVFACFVLFFIINSVLLNFSRVWISLVGDMRESITSRKGKHYRADLFVQAGRLSCLSG